MTGVQTCALPISNITYNGTKATLNGFTSNPTANSTNNPYLFDNYNSSGVPIYTLIDGLQLTQSGATVVSIYGYVTMSSGNLSSLPTWRYLQYGSLSIQVKNRTTGVVAYTFYFEFGGAASLYQDSAGSSTIYGCSLYVPFSASIPLVLDGNIYDFYAAGTTQLGSSPKYSAFRDSNGVPVSTSVYNAINKRTYITYSLFQVAA